jgi:hypothetical protein
MKNKPIKIRRTWNINPRLRIKESKKIYNRQLSKKQLKETLKNEDF